MRAEGLALLVLMAACAPRATAATAPPPQLRPYSTTTPSPTQPVSTRVVGAASSPMPSPTPSQYTVAPGDTLSQIAEKLNIPLDALLAANPGVDPNAMSVGSILKIPGNQQNKTGEGTPTPVPLSITQVKCYPISDGGAWCFVLVRNDTPGAVENITTRLTLSDSSGRAVGDQAIVLPLDILQAGESLALAAYFPPEVPLDVKPQAQVLTATSLLAGDSRYLPATVGNTLVTVDSSGRAAQARGTVVLPANSKPAALVWIAAVAYDAAGDVVGLRRWQATSGLAPGGTLPFSFEVSSVAGPIDRVDFAVEARPQ